MKRKLISALLALALAALSFTACGDGAASRQTSETAGVYDRAGNIVTLPENIESIISMGPSKTEMLTALGFADLLVGIDSFSVNVEGIPEGLPVFDMWAPEIERIIDIFPDVIFASGMTMVGGLDPFAPASDLGITVIYVPSSESIEGIIEDIRFVSMVMGVPERGEEIVSYMEEAIAAFREIGSSVPNEERKTVYFEISPSPWLYSFGRGVFLNELLEIIGAVNILADYEGWLPVADEQVLDRNPDVIITNVNFLDNPIDEIVQRPGWSAVTAAADGNVFVVCPDASSRPSHRIILALEEIARAVYPELFR